MGWIIDVAAGALRGAGKPELADWIKNAPSKIGEQIGKIVVSGQQEGGTLTPEAVIKLEELQKANPAELAVIPRDLEEEYAADIDAFRLRVLGQDSSQTMRVVAVRGFLHDPGCTSVWIIDSERTSTIQAERLGGSGSKKQILVWPTIEILLFGAKSDDELTEMNCGIERDIERFLINVRRDYSALVRSVTRNAVHVEMRAQRGARVGDAIEYPITGRAGIAEAFRTLEPALRAQGRRLADYREAKKRE